MRFGTERKTPARPVSGKGFAPQLLRSVQQWTKQFNVPLLSLTPVDTIRQLVLNPSQLTTLREAQTLVARTDSTRKALVQNFQQLGIEQTVDSARALADRLSHADIKALGLAGLAMPSNRCSKRWGIERSQEASASPGAKHPERRPAADERGFNLG